jgi:hypothetical protein
LSAQRDIPEEAEAVMLSRHDADRMFRSILGEFAPDWHPVGEITEVTVRDPEHWLSGNGTFAVMLQHRASGGLKVLGRRAGAGPGATYHRGISFAVLQAYGDRNMDPVRRYLDEIGLAPYHQRSSAVLRTA